MLLRLNDHNEVIITEKFLLIKDLKTIYNKYSSDHDARTAHLAVLYYMYHFDSRFLWLYRDDETKRLAEVRKFIADGKKVTICNTMRRAMRAYKALYDEEQVSIYCTMRDNMKKLRDYADSSVLILPPDYDPDIHGTLNVIEAKELMAINKAIPEQWKLMDAFETELKEYTKSQVDIYGGGSLGAYE